MSIKRTVLAVAVASVVSNFALAATNGPSNKNDAEYQDGAGYLDNSALFPEVSESPDADEAVRVDRAYTATDFRNGLEQGMDDFFGDSSVDIKVRSMYHNKDYRETFSDTEQHGIGVEVNFESGWINDWIGFDMSSYSAFAVDGDGNYKESGSSSGMFLREEDGDFKGYNKIGQAYLKARFALEDVDTFGQFRIGRQKIYKGLMSTSTSRLTPLTWEAAQMEVNVAGTEFYGVYATGISQRNNNSSDGFTGYWVGDSFVDEEWEKNEIDHVFTYGVRRQPSKGIGYEFAVGEGQSYSRTYMARVNNTFDIVGGYEVFVDAQYYQAQSLDEENVCDPDYPTCNYPTTENADWNQYNRPFDLDAKAEKTNINLMLSKGDWSGWLSTQYVSAPLTTAAYHNGENGNGQYDGSMANNDYNTDYSWIGVPNYIGMFDYDGERSYQIGTRYHWDKQGLRGFYSSFSYTTGSGANRLDTYTGEKSEGKEWERTFEFKYKFQSEALKGLNARLVQSTYRSNFNPDAEDVRFILDYYISVI